MKRLLALATLMTAGLLAAPESAQAGHCYPGGGFYGGGGYYGGGGLYGYNPYRRGTYFGIGTRNFNFSYYDYGRGRRGHRGLRGPRGFRGHRGFRGRRW